MSKMGNYKLVDRVTRQELVIGNKYMTSRNEEVILVSTQKPHTAASTGRILIEYCDNGFMTEYFPAVIGAEWELVKD